MAHCMASIQLRGAFKSVTTHIHSRQGTHHHPWNHEWPPTCRWQVPNRNRAKPMTNCIKNWGILYITTIHCTNYPYCIMYNYIIYIYIYYIYIWDKRHLVGLLLWITKPKEEEALVWYQRWSPCFFKRWSTNIYDGDFHWSIPQKKQPSVALICSVCVTFWFETLPVEWTMESHWVIILAGVATKENNRRPFWILLVGNSPQIRCCKEVSTPNKQPSRWSVRTHQSEIKSWLGHCEVVLIHTALFLSNWFPQPLWLTWAPKSGNSVPQNWMIFF